MANAKTAPLQEKENIVLSKEDQYLNMEFDPYKRYVFELAEVLPEREIAVYEIVKNRSYILAHKKHTPYRNLVLTSQIIWKGRRRMLRYYDGCDTLFVDEQPKEKDIIDQFIAQTPRRIFEHGKLIVNGYERMLLLYMNIAGWNAKSPFRTATTDAIFICQNPDEDAMTESSLLDLQEEARDLAKNATVKKMRIHANYLNIPFKDYDSGNDLTELQIRTAYRKKALENPQVFIDSYGNSKIEVKYFIDQALKDGTINNKLNPNKATWKSGTEICDISGLKTPDAIADKLFEFSQTEIGEEFTVQIKALYN